MVISDYNLVMGKLDTIYIVIKLLYPLLNVFVQQLPTVDIQLVCYLFIYFF